jgi:hypothetical protein
MASNNNNTPITNSNADAVNHLHQTSGNNLSMAFNIASYNLHGFNQGTEMLDYLCNSLSLDVIFVQEHWLSPFNINNILLFSNNYIAFGSSAMESSVGQSFLEVDLMGG